MFTEEAVEFVKQVCNLDKMVFSTGADVVESYGVVTSVQVEPSGLKDIVKMAKNAKNFVEAYSYTISQHRNWDRELGGLSTMVAY